MENVNNYNQNTDLTSRLIEYLKTIDINDKLEVKPDGNLYTKNKEQKLNKDHTTKIDKQVQIIGQNVVAYFFDLNDQKFKAVIGRINFWRILASIE